MSDAGWLTPDNLDPAKLALELAKAVGKWDTLRNYAKRNYDWIAKGETQVAIFGAGGTGKTTFSKVMTSENPLLVDTTYESNVTQKNVMFPGEVSAKLLVAPGQERYIEDVWPDLFKAMENRRSLAVINLVGFGYHHFDVDSFQAFGVYKEGMNRDDFLAAYLDDRREVEIDGLKAVAKGMKEVEADVWMLTVVAKQDLWWDDRERVQQHYFSTKEDCYSRILQDINDDMHERNLRFSHHFIGASQALANFNGPDGLPLKLTCAGYDLDEHRKHLYNYIRRFNDLLEGKKL